MENKVAHFEIPVDDMSRARQFYSKTFGWQIQDWPMEDGTAYTGVITTEVDEETRMTKKPGGINGGMFERDENLKSPIITINVPSIEECVPKIENAGGQVVVPKTEAKGVGYYAYFRDTEGNVLGLWQKLH